MIPKIGLIGNIENDLHLDIHGAYGRSIECSGALPLVLPYIEDERIIDEFVCLCDGFLFSGGVDLEPSLYGEEKKPTCKTTEPNRDRLELTVFHKVYASGKPILGICRGIQFINAALGGTLYQDIPTEYDTQMHHNQLEGKYDASHPILVDKSSPLFQIVSKETVTGNSFHHQAIKRLSDELCVMARAEDGIIEAVYAPGHPYLFAYQWHPERLYRYADNKALFDDFVKACKANRK